MTDATSADMAKIKTGVATIDVFIERVGPLDEAKRRKLLQFFCDQAIPIIEAQMEVVRREGKSEEAVIRLEMHLTTAFEAIVRARLAAATAAAAIH